MSKFTQYIREKSLLIIAAAIVVAISYSMLQNLMHSLSIGSQIADLKDEMEYYEEEISRDSAHIELLQSDLELERFARERYHMRRANEDIYTFE